MDYSPESVSEAGLVLSEPIVVRDAHKVHVVEVVLLERDGYHPRVLEILGTPV